MAGVLGPPRQFETSLAFLESRAFESWFDPEATGTYVSIAAGTPSPPKVLGGEMLRFGEGAHRFALPSRRDEPIARGVTFEGEGMDRTLVTFAPIRDLEGAVPPLTFRDMTVDCGNDTLLDVRGDAPAVVRFERCRLVRFDSGRGGSVGLKAQVLAAWLTDSRVEVGFGKGLPHYGNVFLCNLLLARFDRCFVEGASLGTADRHAVLFDHCRLGGQTADGRSQLSRPGVVLRETTVVPVADDLAAAKRSMTTRGLSEIDPAWSSAQ